MVVAVVWDNLCCLMLHCLCVQGCHSVAKSPPTLKQSTSQYETHLHLGSDHSVPMTTLVRSDFTAKPITQVYTKLTIKLGKLLYRSILHNKIKIYFANFISSAKPVSLKE